MGLKSAVEHNVASHDTKAARITRFDVAARNNKRCVTLHMTVARDLSVRQTLHWQAKTWHLSAHREAQALKEVTETRIFSRASCLRG
jgi:hypothetical protein